MGVVRRVASKHLDPDDSFAQEVLFPLQGLFHYKRKEVLAPFAFTESGAFQDRLKVCANIGCGGGRG